MGSCMVRTGLGAQTYILRNDRDRRSKERSHISQAGHNPGYTVTTPREFWSCRYCPSERSASGYRL